MAEVLTSLGWIVMLAMIVVLWGVALVGIYMTLSDEDRKSELIAEQGEIETYSPRALGELRVWIENHPDDPYHEIAVDRYNECVDALNEIEETFYDWSQSEIDSLDKL